MLTLQDFSYTLPPELIAQKPLVKRDQSRLLVFSRANSRWRHQHFHQLPQILQDTREKYLIVRNNSQVIPARLTGNKVTGGKVEVFLVHQRQSTAAKQVWECLTKPGLKPDQTVIFAEQNITAVCRKIVDDYTRLIEFQTDPTSFQHFLRQNGQTPIPPYIKSSLPEKKLRQVYQTVYAQKPGSVAAPTAGLHFTKELEQELLAHGHQFADVTLHVSLGTFLGVKCDNIQDHQMHAESFEVNQESLNSIRSAVKMRRKILAVGTTATRVLESIAPTLATNSKTITGETSIFIHPPQKFQLVDALITNFHLPQSTLLMLIAAFTSQPNGSETFQTWTKSPIGQAYQEAIAQKYRFFSFGDAMLII